MKNTTLSAADHAPGECPDRFFRCTEMHGVKINHSCIGDSLHEVEYLIRNGKSGFVCFFEANLFSRSLLEDKVRNVINQALLIYPDGIAPAVCASLCSGESFSRVSGPTFLIRACEYGLDKNWRHFFLGGAEGVAEKLAENLKKKYPGLQVSGTYCPPFRQLTEAEEAEVKEKIESSHTDLLWVGLGGPKQEFWMSAHTGRIRVPVMLGVGAAFDFHSGNRPWAPKIVRVLGIEWLWRMLLGGRKTFVRNVKCVFHIFFVLLTDIFKYKILRKEKGKLLRKFPESGCDC